MEFGEGGEGDAVVAGNFVVGAADGLLLLFAGPLSSVTGALVVLIGELVLTGAVVVAAGFKVSTSGTTGFAVVGGGAKVIGAVVGTAVVGIAVVGALVTGLEVAPLLTGL